MNVLMATQQLLVEPVPDDSVEARAGDMFRSNREQFNKEAREWTKKLAK